MGTPVDPSDPEWEDCNNCCYNLPLTLNVLITGGSLGPVWGQVEWDGGWRCDYYGLLSGAGGGVSTTVEFCYYGSKTLDLGAHGPGLPEGSVAGVVDNCCKLPTGGDDPMGLHWAIW